MPALNRIILINTHMHGIVELNLQGHTNICGTNASGKTTLQRLIPVFYGEYPSRVVPATRDSFERWYLPTEASYIIYEYQRGLNDEDLCQTVLTSSGKGVDYRLIGKGFDLDDYSQSTKSGDRLILSPNELSREIKRQGFICSRKLNTKEFRAIVQNDRSILTGNRDLPGYARLFSLCEADANLRHIEKLAKAVHSKEGKMETIKAMVAAILEEDGVQPGETKLSHNKVEEWIRECKLIKGFEDIRPEFTKLEQAHHEYGQVLQRLAQLKQQYSLDLSKVGSAIAESDAMLEEVVLNLRVMEADWADKRDQLNQTWSAAKGDVESLETNLDKVEGEFDNWQDKDIDELKTNVELLPRWNTELDNAESRLEMLTQQHQDVEATYNKRLIGIRDNYDAETEAYSEQKEELRDQLAEKKTEQQVQLSTVAQKYKDQIVDIKSDYQSQSHEIKNRITELNTLVNNVGFTAQEQGQLDILEHAIKESVTQEDISRDKVKQDQAELATIAKARSGADQQLEKVRKQLVVQQDKVDSVKALLYPGQNTLLEYLRREKPGWEDSIGKVINPELLERTDLQPGSLEPSKSGLWGIQLDLTGLAQPTYAQSEHELKHSLELAQEALETLAVTQNEAEQTLTERNKELRNVELKLTRSQTQLNNTEQARKRSQQDKEDTLREFQQALQERKQSNLDKVTELKAQLDRTHLLEQEAVSDLQDQQRDAEMELKSHWQMLIEDVESQLAQIDTHISQSKAEMKKENAAAEAWLKDELAERGVDVDEIGGLKRNIKQLKSDIQSTEKSRHLVLEYKVWYETYYLGHKVNWQEQLAQAKQTESSTRRELEKQQLAFKQDSELAKSKQTHYERTLKEAQEQEHELTIVNKQLSALKLPNAEVVQDNTNLVQRINEGQSLMAKREELLANIRAYVEHFDQKIAAQGGTGFYDAWERSREECSSINEQGLRSFDHVKLVGHLDRLINELVPQRISAIREQGRIFGLALSEYYKILKDIEGHIGSQSKRISKEVDEELFLDGVSDSAVKIRSKISELEFWPDLQQFNQLYNDWMAQGAHELPGEIGRASCRERVCMFV